MTFAPRREICLNMRFNLWKQRESEARMKTTVPTFDQRQFRNALGSFATGVTIVTTCDGHGNDFGLTVNSFNSVSLDPPMVLWSLARNSVSLPAFVGASHFAVHVLASDQESLSARFATKGVDKFGGISLRRGHGNIPLLEGCAACFECKMSFRYEGGDHQIFVGEVVNFEHFERPPLVYQAGNYAMLLKRPRAAKAPLADASDSNFSRNSLGYLCSVANYCLHEGSGEELARQHLTKLDAWILNLLGEKEEQSVAELNTQMGGSRWRVTTEVMQCLVDRALVMEKRQNRGETGFRLTTSGRDMLISFVAASKATEESALQELDHAEAELLKGLLKRVIRELMTKHA